MDTQEAAPPIYAGIEMGSDAKRDKRTVEATWARGCEDSFTEEEKNLNIDKKVVELANEALQAGRKKLVLVDLGSGPDGVFVNSFVDSHLQYNDLYAFLQQHDDFEVEIVGITAAAAKSPQGHIIGEPKETTFANGSKITVTNKAYTVTRAHTLGNFLSTQDTGANNPTENVDILLSTKALGYFTPENFGQTLSDIGNHLLPGGEAYVADYNMVPPGYYRKHQGGGEVSLHIAADRNPDNPLAFRWITVYQDASPEKRKSVLMKLIKFAENKRFVTGSRLIDLASHDIYPSEESDEKNEVDKIKASLNGATTVDELIQRIDALDTNLFERVDWSWVYHNIVRELSSERTPVAASQWEKVTEKKAEHIENLKQKPELDVKSGRFNILIKKKDNHQDT